MKDMLQAVPLLMACAIICVMAFDGVFICACLLQIASEPHCQLTGQSSMLFPRALAKGTIPALYLQSSSQQAPLHS
jgi:hypothetical protein